MPTPDRPTSGQAGPVVLVPVKSFAAAKTRLAPALDAASRAALARAMAELVLAAADPLPVAVACDDPDVAAWATDRGAEVVTVPGPGLSAAVTAGVAQLARESTTEVIVAHGDLPFARHLGSLAGGEGVTLVPDRHDDGTNVVCVDPRSGFRFSYGPGSFSRHRAEAARLALPLRVLRPPELCLDVDEPDDLLAGPAHLGLVGAPPR